MRRSVRILCIAAFLVSAALTLGMNTNVQASVSQVAATKTKTPVPDEPTAEPTNEAIDDDTFPEVIDPKGTNPKLIVARLQADGLVPKGGKQMIAVPDSFVTTSNPGISTYPLGRGTTVKNMVFQFGMGWSRAGIGSGCGIEFRSFTTRAKQGNFWRYILQETGAETLLHIVNGKSAISVSLDTTDYKAGYYAIVTILALDDTIALYLNGARQFVKTTTDVTDEGNFFLVIYNDDLAETKETTDCRYQNIWAWSFD